MRKNMIMDPGYSSCQLQLKLLPTVLQAVFRSALLVGLLGLSACANPFTTRTPEPPDQNNSTFIDPITPDDVFLNLRIAFNERNVETYMRCFVDTSRSQQRYRFMADPGIAATQPGTFSSWQLEDERRYFLQMVQATPGDSVLNLNFTVESRTETASTATITQNYEIVVQHSRQELGFGGIIRGQGLFFLERDQDSAWSIYRWEDVKTSDDSFSWTELKSFFQ